MCSRTNRHLPLVSFLLLALSIVVGCKEERSPLVVDSSTMEKVLYDYHIADGMIMSSNMDSLKTSELINSVYAKYGINQEMFDSSMVYYLRHAEDLTVMYQHINDRIEREANRLGVDNNFSSTLSATGDTADIWPGARAEVMRVIPPYNKIGYVAEVDSTFKAGDKFILSFKTDFLYQDGNRNGFAVMALRLANDSVITRSCSMMNSSTFNIEMEDSRRLGIKGLRCYILDRDSDNPHDKNSSTMRMMVVSDIKLIRMHTKAPEGSEVEAADTLKKVEITEIEKVEPINQNNTTNEKIIKKQLPLVDEAPVPRKLNRPVGLRKPSMH